MKQQGKAVKVNRPTSKWYNQHPHLYSIYLGNTASSLTQSPLSHPQNYKQMIDKYLTHQQQLRYLIKDTQKRAIYDQPTTTDQQHQQTLRERSKRMDQLWEEINPLLHSNKQQHIENDILTQAIKQQVNIYRQAREQFQELTQGNREQDTLPQLVGEDGSIDHRTLNEVKNIMVAYDSKVKLAEYQSKSLEDSTRNQKSKTAILQLINMESEFDDILPLYAKRNHTIQIIQKTTTDIIKVKHNIELKQKKCQVLANKIQLMGGRGEEVGLEGGLGLQSRKKTGSNIFGGQQQLFPQGQTVINKKIMLLPRSTIQRRQWLFGWLITLLIFGYLFL